MLPVLTDRLVASMCFYSFHTARIASWEANIRDFAEHTSILRRLGTPTPEVLEGHGCEAYPMVPSHCEGLLEPMEQCNVNATYTITQAMVFGKGITDS